MTPYKVLVSACFLGERVRYDEKHNLLEAPLLERLKAEERIVSACPEILGGLPVPRSHSSIKQLFPIKIVNLDDEDVTPEFIAGAEAVVDLAKKQGCVAALMKAHSPSCGNLAIPATTFSGREQMSAGVAARELMQAGIPVFNEQQLEQLEELLQRLEEGALSESA